MPFLIILALAVMLLGFYLVIKAAVKDAIYESDATKLLAEIRDLLKMQSMERKAVNIPYTSDEEKSTGKDGDNIPDNE